MEIELRENETDPTVHMGEYKGPEWFVTKSGNFRITNERIIFTPLAAQTTMAEMNLSDIESIKKFLVFAVHVKMKDGSRRKFRITRRGKFFKSLNRYYHA